MVYKILSIDGGGVRGVIPLTILKRLVATKGLEKTFDSVDLIAGTSVGGIFALFLAAGFTFAQISDIYTKMAPDVFSYANSRSTGPYWYAKYGNDRLKKDLETALGAKKDWTLGQLNKKVMIVSYQICNNEKGSWRTVVFNNFQGSELANEKVIDVMMRTSAAPTYFPIYGNFVDGGVVANNPTMMAIAQSMEMGYDLQDLRVISIGTGKNKIQQSPDAKDGDWGYYNWLIKPRNTGNGIVDLLMDAGQDLTGYQVKMIMKAACYVRCQPELSKSIPLDDASQISYLIDQANNFSLTDAIRWIQDNWLPAAPRLYANAMSGGHESFDTSPPTHFATPSAYPEDNA